SSVSSFQADNGPSCQAGGDTVVVDLLDFLEAKIAQYHQRLALPPIEGGLDRLVVVIRHTIPASDFVKHDQRRCLDPVPELFRPERPAAALVVPIKPALLRL